MKIETIRKEILQKLGIVPNLFITKTTEDSIIIEEEKNFHNNNLLQKVIINNIPASNIKVWLLDFEMQVKGFTPSSKTVEKVIVTLENNVLTFFMIELKSSIKHQMPNERKISTLNIINGKFEDSISRIIFLLTFDSHHDWINFKEWDVKFKGIVFYNKQIQSSIDEGTRICKIISSKEKKGLLECRSTFLGLRKIEVKFIKNTGEKKKLEANFSDINN